MPGKHLFEYAVIRIVPKVERKEFVNVGVVLYCADQKFLEAKLEINTARLKAFSAHINIDEVTESLYSFQQICTGNGNSGPIGQLRTAERFRWLTAARSTVIQTSKVHSGLCDDANETLLKLFRGLVCE